MDRRAMLGMLGAGAVGVAAFSGREAEARELDKTHEDCLKACSDCARTCDETFHHCYQEVAEGKRDHAKPLHYLSDCAGFCGLSACMIARRSPLMVDSCASCAEACRKTAAVVEKFDSDEMRRAAEKLRACEKSCINMVAAMKGHAPSAAETK
ncbi:MAG TPA: four-helix bundle copper-binding protein [Isosphaeraceae bacterium]|jgi:hypothetical protein